MSKKKLSTQYLNSNIPAGRYYDDSGTGLHIYVRKSGKAGVHQLKMDKLNPKDWTDEMIYTQISNTDWVQRLIYLSVTKKRLFKIRDHYRSKGQDNDLPVSYYDIQNLLDKHGLYVTTTESILTANFMRHFILQVLFMLYLLLENPFM